MMSSTNGVIGARRCRCTYSMHWQMMLEWVVLQLDQIGTELHRQFWKRLLSVLSLSELSCSFFCPEVVLVPVPWPPRAAGAYDMS